MQSYGRQAKEAVCQMHSLQESIDLKIQMDALDVGAQQQNGDVPSPTELSTKTHIPSSTDTSNKVNFV